jgi:hypothetical protein
MTVRRTHLVWLPRVRRFLVLLALTFSLGGFSFYAAVVVPIGGRVLDATSQGFVTREVTQVLNLAGVTTALLLSWEAAAEWKRRRRGANVSRVVAVTILGLCCGVLIVLHPRLDTMLDGATMSVSQPARFYRLHQVYLWISSLQWLASLFALWLLSEEGCGRSNPDSPTGSHSGSRKRTP